MLAGLSKEMIKWPCQLKVNEGNLTSFKPYPFQWNIPSLDKFELVAHELGLRKRTYMIHCLCLPEQTVSEAELLSKDKPATS